MMKNIKSAMMMMMTTMSERNSWRRKRGWAPSSSSSSSVPKRSLRFFVFCFFVFFLVFEWPQGVHSTLGGKRKMMEEPTIFVKVSVKSPTLHFDVMADVPSSTESLQRLYKEGVTKGAISHILEFLRNELEKKKMREEDEMSLIEEEESGEGQAGEKTKKKEEMKKDEDGEKANKKEKKNEKTSEVLWIESHGEVDFDKLMNSYLQDEIFVSSSVSGFLRQKDEEIPLIFHCPRKQPGGIPITMRLQSVDEELTCLAAVSWDDLPKENGEVELEKLKDQKELMNVVRKTLEASVWQHADLKGTRWMFKMEEYLHWLRTEDEEKTLKKFVMDVKKVKKDGIEAYYIFGVETSVETFKKVFLGKNKNKNKKEKMD